METVFALLLLTLSLNVKAYTFKEENRPISPKHVLQEAVKLGLRPSPDEIRTTKELQTWSDEKIKKHLENDAPEPLLREATRDAELIRDAKTIAKTEAFKAVQKNWGKIRNSALNQYAVESFEEFIPYLKRDLDKIEYSNPNGKQSYLFLLPWADIYVNRNLKKVSWVIRIGSHLDQNRLAEGVERIHVPERSAE